MNTTAAVDPVTLLPLRSMDRIPSTPTVLALVFSQDAALRKDVSARCDALSELSVMTLPVETFARVHDVALSHRPQAIFLDLLGDLESALRMATRIRDQLPTTIIVGLYNPLRLPDGLEKSDLFLDAIRRGVQDFVCVPVSSEEARRVLRRAAATPVLAANTALRREPGALTSFTSSKGGVGKTTLVANIGVALAKHFPGEVAIIDASLDFGNVCDYLNLRASRTLFDAVQARDRLDRDLLEGLMTRHSEHGLMVLSGPRRPEEMRAITDEDITQVLLAARGAFRHVLVDTLPIFNSVSIAAGDLSTSIVVVTEAIVPAINGTRELLSRMTDVGIASDRVRLALNKYGGAGGTNVESHAVAEALQRSIDWVLPYDKGMLACANLGLPYLAMHSRSVLARKLEGMAANLGNIPAQQAASWWRRLLSLGR